MEKQMSYKIINNFLITFIFIRIILNLSNKAILAIKDLFINFDYNTLNRIIIFKYINIKFTL